ncbi:MAG: DEAD/DEAH box helicase family protein [Acinetobacter sp.]
MSKLTPRPYQKRAIDAAINWIKKNTEPCLLDLATAAGKSIIAAILAHEIINMSNGKKVLCLCPDSRLVKQNAEAYSLISDEYSIYSASIGKSLRHNFIVATEGTFISIADKTSGEFCAVIMDEADRITNTNKKIIEILREKNPNLRVIGMTGSPWRTKEGYIYEIDLDNSIVEETTNPYYKKVVARVTPKELIDLGFATPPKLIPVSEKYETENIKLNSSGTFNQDDIDHAFVGRGNKTAAVVQDIVNKANERSARGVLIYAATIDHCHEIMESLPNYNSAMIHGGMSDAHNKQAVQDLRDQKIKYLVNVGMAAVGLSVNHIDIVAFLRLTESSRFYTQVLGRGMRLDDGKLDFWVLDYTANIENLFPSGDLFAPEIVAYGKKPSTKHDIQCPECHNVNQVALRPNPDGFNIDSFGYFLDLAGERIEIEGQPFPAHYSRRCSHIEPLGKNEFKRCEYYWSYKECPECSEKNDIAARKCTGCGTALIDPNDKLIAEFKAFKKDLSQVQTDAINFIRKKPFRSKAGNDALMVSFGTPDRIVQVTMSNKIMPKFYDKFLNDPTFNPRTITYKKSSSGYMHIYDFNRETDLEKFNREHAV